MDRRRARLLCAAIALLACSTPRPVSDLATTTHKRLPKPVSRAACAASGRLAGCVPDEGVRRPALRARLVGSNAAGACVVDRLLLLYAPGGVDSQNPLSAQLVVLPKGPAFPYQTLPPGMTLLDLARPFTERFPERPVTSRVFNRDVVVDPTDCERREVSYTPLQVWDIQFDLHPTGLGCQPNIFQVVVDEEGAVLAAHDLDLLCQD